MLFSPVGQINEFVAILFACLISMPTIDVGPTFSTFNAMPGKLTQKIIAMVSDPW